MCFHIEIFMLYPLISNDHSISLKLGSGVKYENLKFRFFFVASLVPILTKTQWRYTQHLLSIYVTFFMGL